MIRLPQEASAMKGQPLSKIIPMLQKAVTVDQLYTLDGSDGRCMAVWDSKDDSILPFTTPILVRTATGNKVMCVDVRKTSREYEVGLNKIFTPKPYTETKFLTDYASCILAWDNDATIFKGIYFDVCRVYATLMSTKLAKQLVLNPQQTNMLQICFAYYFATRYIAEKELRDLDYRMLVESRLARILPFNSDEIFTTLAMFERKVFDNIDEFCQVIKENSDNPKIGKLNGLFVTTVMMTSWAFSPNARELMAVAVEYPPTFISLVVRACQERSFKDTSIAQVALRILPPATQKQMSLIYSDIVYRTMLGRV